MRKVMLLAAMLAMVLAAAVPAFAQDAVAVDDSVAQGGDVQYVDCSQVQAALQGQYGDAVADDEAVAAVASEQGITQNQANACLGEISDLNQGNDNVGDVVEDDDDASAVAAADASAAAAAGTPPLPPLVAPLLVAPPPLPPRPSSPRRVALRCSPSVLALFWSPVASGPQDRSVTN